MPQATCSAQQRIPNGGRRAVRCTVAGSSEWKRQTAAGEAWPGVRRLMDGREDGRMAWVGGWHGWVASPGSLQGQHWAEARHPCWPLRLASATFRMRAWLSCRFGRSRRAQQSRGAARDGRGQTPVSGRRRRGDGQGGDSASRGLKAARRRIRGVGKHVVRCPRCCRAQKGKGGLVWCYLSSKQSFASHRPVHTQTITRRPLRRRVGAGGGRAQ